jgi:hypothetical protein
VRVDLGVPTHVGFPRTESTTDKNAFIAGMSWQNQTRRLLISSDSCTKSNKRIKL